MTLAFDLDGTLISVEQKQTNLLRAVARASGLTPDVSKIWLAKREGASTRAALLEEGVPPDLCDAISACWVAQVETSYWMSLDTVLEGATACLCAAARKHPLALVSARQNSYLLRQQLLRLDLLPFFASVHRVRPKHAAAEKAEVLGRIGATCFFGDTESDFQAAQRADIRFFGVSSGQRSADYLSRAGIGGVFSSVSLAVQAAQ